jgi:hypothetical protein
MRARIECVLYRMRSLYLLAIRAPHTEDNRSSAERKSVCAYVRGRVRVVNTCMSCVRGSFAMCMYAWVTCVQHATFFSFYLLCKAYETDTILKVAVLLYLLLLLLPFMQSL